MRVTLGTVSGHPLRGVVDAGDGAAGQRLGAEAARGVRGVPLGVGQLLVVGLHGRRHHVEHDDGRAHGLTEHVLGSGRERAGSHLRERFGKRMERVDYFFNNRKHSCRTDSTHPFYITYKIHLRPPEHSDMLINTHCQRERL